jgi:hypothetical protein
MDVLNILTRMYFKKIADILGKQDASENLVSAFVKFFKSENPRFSEGKFRAAINRAGRGDKQ